MHETTTVFAVPDIACNRCRQAIQADLADVSGVADVRVDVRGRIVRIAHDDEAVPVAALTDRLRRLGYPVAGTSEAA